MKLNYKKGDMFSNLDNNVIYLHSCNAQGHWGAGIAVLFKRIFPEAYEEHIRVVNHPGMGYLVNHQDYKVACLITSKHYGRYKDSPHVILNNTKISLTNLLNSIPDKDIKIYSPKINSGYFSTPWDKTSKVIEEVCSDFLEKNINWVVWEL